MSLDICPIALGTTLKDWKTGETIVTHWAQGRLFDVENVQAQSGTRTAATRPNGSTLKVMVVRNVSGGVLLPKRTVQLKTDNTLHGILNEVHGYANTVAAPLCGFVDPYLPSTGVPDDNLFLMVVHGPMYAVMSGTEADTLGDITVGLPLVTAATGTSLTDTDGGRVARANPAAPADATAAQAAAILHMSNVIATTLEVKDAGDDAGEDILVMVNCRWVH